MEQDICLICKSEISIHQKVDIQLSTTEQGHVNIEEFIKASILYLEANTILSSSFLCHLCYSSVNKFEEYLIKSKEIQHSLAQMYFADNMKLEGIQTPTFHNLNTTAETIVKDETIDSSINSISNSEISEETEHLSPRTKRERKASKKIEKTQTIETESDEVLPRKRRTRKQLSQEDTESNMTMEEDDNDRQTPENSQKYCCEICGKICNKGNAAKHMNIHTKTKPFNCEFCHKNFTQKVDLRRHLNIHMGIFPYVCEFCGKKFAQHTSYNIHKKNHLGKRDHQCIVCGKGLLSKSHLVRHMKTHTSEKNFGCEICGKTFAENYNMLSHMKKVHHKDGTRQDSSDQSQGNISGTWPDAS